MLGPKPIQHLPIGSLKIFGTNLYNESLFRVVWSESVMYLVGATHVDYDGEGYSNDQQIIQRGGKDPNLLRKETAYRWLPLYPAIRQWVLECWKSPIAFTGCTMEQYNIRYMDPMTGLLTLGPYPDRGVYCECFRFPNEPTFSTVQNTIYRIKAGWGYSYAEHLAAQKDADEKEKKNRERTVRDIFLDSQQAFKNRPSNVRPGKRTKESIPLKYTADDVNLGRSSFQTR